MFISSDFGDIFDTKHFIASLQIELRIIIDVLAKFLLKVRKRTIVSLPLISWSDESYSMLDVSKKQRKKNRQDTYLRAVSRRCRAIGEQQGSWDHGSR